MLDSSTILWVAVGFAVMIISLGFTTALVLGRGPLFASVVSMCPIIVVMAMIYFFDLGESSWTAPP